jgi:hypothetical protein
MTEKCFDEGTIQAFLDGELAQEISQKVTRHVAACDVCAFMLADAEEETAFAFSALEREFDTLVPTTRLWTKINDSIVAEKKQTSVWQRLLSFVSGSLMNPSLAVAAGLIVVLGILAVTLSVNKQPSAVETAATTTENGYQSIRQTALDQTASGSVNASTEIAAPPIIAAAAPKKFETRKAEIYQASNRENARRQNARNSLADVNYSEKKQTDSETPRPKTVEAAYLPGEESYVKTIASLSQTVETQKDTALRPSARISFERDMAVVDDAINKMKREVSKNPKNESAKQILYSSYQNKIDLLSSVAEKTELMASLK